MIKSQIESSPWGHVTSHGQIAPGIVFVNTSNHGGLWLSPARVQQFRMRLPEFRPHVGYPWLEEDCDASAAALVWPECYGPEVIRNAVRMYISADWLTNAKCVQAFLAVTAEGRSLIDIAERWECEHSMHWETGTACTKYGGWLVWFHRVGDKRHIVRWFTDYPRQTIYTDAELEQSSLSEEMASKDALQAEVRRQTVLAS